MPNALTLKSSRLKLMGINYNPKIVTDGLVLHLDAANVKSYPGTGTVWKDLSGNGNDGTLVNGVGYNSANNGSMVFDGANDYGILNNKLNLTTTAAITFCSWIKTTQPNTGIWCEHSIDFNQNNSFLVDFGEFGGSGSFQFSDKGDAGYNIAYTSPGYHDGNWHYFSAVSNRTLLATDQISLYVDSIYNTILHPSHRANNNTNYSTFRLYLFTRNGASYFARCNVGLVQIYNRALSVAEIQQNFNATRGRYGI